MLSGLSVIICTKNRSSDLEITLRSIFNQHLLPDSLVIIDDGNATETRTILKKYYSLPEVKIIHIHPKRESTGLPAARNLGIQHVPDSTDIILFIDDDVTLEDGYLETILDTFQKNPDACGVTGLIRTMYYDRCLPIKALLLVTGWIIPTLVPASRFGPRVTRTAEALYPLFRKPGTDTVPAQWLSGCNMGYRSTVFTESFRFDENLIRYAPGEDMLFSHRLYQGGGRLLLSYNAHLTHRISGKNRMPPFRKLIMVFGYRNYEISRFIPSRFYSSILYSVFIMQYVISSVIISLRNEKGLASAKEVIRAYGMTREFEQEIRSGCLERFNDFLSTLP